MALDKMRFAFFNSSAWITTIRWNTSQLSPNDHSHVTRDHLSRPSRRGAQSPFLILDLTFMGFLGGKGGHTWVLWLQICGNKRHLAGPGRLGWESKTLFQNLSWVIRRLWPPNPNRTPTFS